MVLGIVLPVVHINVGQARNEKLKFLFIEYGNQVCGNNVMESLKIVSLRKLKCLNEEFYHPGSVAIVP